MKRYSKAIAGLIGATASALGAALVDGSFTASEGWTALGLGLIVGGGIVYVAPKNAE